MSTLKVKVWLHVLVPVRRDTTFGEVMEVVHKLFLLGDPYPDGNTDERYVHSLLNVITWGPGWGDKHRECVGILSFKNILINEDTRAGDVLGLMNIGARGLDVYYDDTLLPPDALLWHYCSQRPELHLYSALRRALDIIFTRGGDARR